jgi:hypothetical protein
VAEPGWFFKITESLLQGQVKKASAESFQRLKQPLEAVPVP